MVSWGVQGTAGYQTAFGYSANSNSGAMDHNGNNLYWANVPKLGVWHHLVYTFDGTNQCVYRDGALDNLVPLSGNLTPVSTQPIHPGGGTEQQWRVGGRWRSSRCLDARQGTDDSAALTAAQVHEDTDEPTKAKKGGSEPMRWLHFD